MKKPFRLGAIELNWIRCALFPVARCKVFLADCVCEYNQINKSQLTYKKLYLYPIQSNPIFILKTQLTERSRITDKHSENHNKKHREH